MARPKKFKTNALEFFEDERGFYYLRTGEGEDITEVDIAGLNAWVATETSGERKPMLFELSFGSTISAGVQAFFAENGARYSTADAILISTFAHKVMATFYLRNHKPNLPTRVFNDVFSALDWIETQKRLK